MVAPKVAMMAVVKAAWTDGKTAEMTVETLGAT